MIPLDDSDADLPVDQTLHKPWRIERLHKAPMHPLVVAPDAHVHRERYVDALWRSCSLLGFSNRSEQGGISSERWRPSGFRGQRIARNRLECTPDFPVNGQRVVRSA